MNFEEFIDDELRILNITKEEDGLTNYGKESFKVTRCIKLLLPNKQKVEEYLRTNIKKNNYKEHMQYMYRNFLISEGYIEPDEIS